MSDNNSTSQVIVLSEYEEKQIKSIIAWINKEPSVFSKASSFFSSIFETVISPFIPKSLIKSVLDGSNFIAGFLADEGDICRDGKVSKIEELQTKNLKLSDDLADKVHNWAIGIAMAEGAATGATGLFGIAVDIPSLITLSLRTIHKIGLCYGYRADTFEEKQFVLNVLSAASSNTPQEKAIALFSLNAMKQIIKKQAWKAIDKAAEKAIAEKKLTNEALIGLLRQVVPNLTKRKATQVIPLVGAFIGGAMSADFIKDVGWAATRMYQKRWLEDNNKWQEIKNL